MKHPDNKPVNTTDGNNTKNNYAQIVRDRASAPAPAGTRPYGIPVDDAEFLVFLAAGNFTPDQVRTIRQMITMMEGPLATLPEGPDKDKGTAMLNAMKDAVKDYPVSSSNPFNP